MWDQEPYSLISKQVRDAWQSGGHPSSIFGHAMKELFRIKPIDGVFVCEHSSADYENSRCTGDPTQSWFYAGTDFEEVQMPERLEQSSAIWTPTPVISFHYRRADETFVITWFSGGRAGHGHKYRIVNENGTRVLEPYGYGWKS